MKPHMVHDVNGGALERACVLMQRVATWLRNEDPNALSSWTDTYATLLDQFIAAPFEKHTELPALLDGVAKAVAGSRHHFGAQKAAEQAVRAAENALNEAVQRVRQAAAQPKPRKPAKRRARR